MKLWPFHRTAPAPELKSLTAPDPLIEAIFGLSATTDGIRVSTQDALRVPVVSNSIALLSGAVASLDVTVTRREGAIETAAPEHPVARLLNGHANDWQSGHELIRQLMIDALMSDAGGLACSVSRL